MEEDLRVQLEAYQRGELDMTRTVVNIDLSDMDDVEGPLDQFEQEGQLFETRRAKVTVTWRLEPEKKEVK